MYGALGIVRADCAHSQWPDHLRCHAAQIPYFIVINTSVFTDSPASGQEPSVSYKVYNTPQIFSFTFAAIGVCVLLS